MENGATHTYGDILVFGDGNSNNDGDTVSYRIERASVEKNAL